MRHSHVSARIVHHTKYLNIYAFIFQCKLLTVTQVSASCKEKERKREIIFVLINNVRTQNADQCDLNLIFFPQILSFYLKTSDTDVYRPIILSY